MNELSLIRSIRKWCASAAAGGLVAGIGDDCAILRTRAGEDLLVTTDLLIEGIHFTRAQSSAADVGWKAVARGLSDIAAMGGDPRFALISLALPRWADMAYVRALYRSAGTLARRHGVRIVGGDVSRATKLAADIVVLGAVPRGKALRRSGARPGDVIWVSGALGRAAARGYKDRPAPRIELGRNLRGRATACMDLSDGLALDLHRLALESGLSAELDGAFPSAAGAGLEHVLFGGEDYELLCTMPPRVRPSSEWTRVGVMTKGRAGRVMLCGKPLPVKGWDPLR